MLYSALKVAPHRIIKRSFLHIYYTEYGPLQFYIQQAKKDTKHPLQIHMTAAHADESSYIKR